MNRNRNFFYGAVVSDVSDVSEVSDVPEVSDVSVGSETSVSVGSADVACVASVE